MGWIQHWVRPGDVVLDVGANRGEVTRELVQQGASVIAIEPHRDMVALLRESFPQITVIQAAAWESPGRITLYHSQDAAQSSLFPPNVLQPTGETDTVPSVTLDQVCQTPTAIKIDAQGAEAAILRGAKRLLTEARPVWYVELWRDGLQAAGSSVRAVCDVFDHAGYRPEGQTWAQVCEGAERQRGHSSVDVLAVPQERAA